jgi:hypothetical protein
MLLCKRADPTTDDPDFADTLAGYFQQALADSHSTKRAIFVALAWGVHSQTGELDSEITTRVFAAALAPSAKGSLFGEFPDVGDYRTYWGRVYHKAVTLVSRRESEATAQFGDIPHADDEARSVPDPHRGERVTADISPAIPAVSGQADAANQRIPDTLGSQAAGQDPGDEGDDDGEPTA